MTKLLYAASAAAILTVAGHLPAMAQSSSSSMTAPSITCRDISSMDRDTARSVVFYLSGFQAASSMSTASGAGATSSSGSSSTAADAGSSGSSGTTAGSTDATGSGSSSTTADAGSAGSSGSAGGASDTTGSTSAAGGSSDTSGSTASSGTSGSSGASSAMMAQLPGFSSVDIDKIMSDCQSSPDKQLSDMMGTTTP